MIIKVSTFCTFKFSFSIRQNLYAWTCVFFLQSTPTVLPIKYVPADNISQPHCPVYAHYIVPQNVPLTNATTVDPGPRYITDSNMMPYYITQPQVSDKQSAAVTPLAKNEISSFSFHFGKNFHSCN